MGVYFVTLCDNVRSCEFRKALNVEILFLLTEKSQLRWFDHVTRTSQERSARQVLLAYTHGKASQRLTKDQMAWLHLWRCLVPPWCGASRTIRNCWKSWGISSLIRSTAPASPCEEKRAWKWRNEWMLLQPPQKDVQNSTNKPLTK